MPKVYLINITAKKLNSFEVDEVVKKITSEVDPEVEFIKGCIIDPSLEEKFRVSIVATSLDGQQLNRSQLSIWFIEFRTEIQAIQIFQI